MSIKAFHNDIYSYSRKGILTPLSESLGLTSTTCPEGRVLRETGKVLVPGANPGINTYMVSVYDAISFEKGYIDPNCQAFTVYNEDKPYLFGDGIDPNPLTSTLAGNYILTNENYIDLAPSVYTAGDVVASGQIRSRHLINLGEAKGQVFVIDPRIGQHFTISDLSGISPILIDFPEDMRALPNLYAFNGSIINIVVKNGGDDLVFLRYQNFEHKHFIKMQNGSHIWPTGNVVIQPKYWASFQLICINGVFYQIGASVDLYGD
jgi:hypothetical protein